MRLAQGIAAIGFVVLSACATSSTRSQVGTTTTTSADPYAPGAVELYVARRSGQGACPQDLPSNIEFPALAADLPASEIADVSKWAACLNHPELQHATVVLVGGQAATDPDSLFVQRAQRIRAELVRHGVDARRIVIGAPNQAREGGRYAATNAVRLEISTTTSETMRAVAPLPMPDGRRRGVR
jgi:hypothetical protein